MRKMLVHIGNAARSWVDNEAPPRSDRTNGVDGARLVPFLLLHGGCLAVIWVGWSWPAVATALFLYLSRVFFITGFYHRYFSHRTFETSRLGQFIFAVCGNLAAQRGPLWWAAHHRRHHGVSDREGDPHSPHEHSIYWAHMGWITARENFPTDVNRIKDLSKYPELRWLDRFDTVVPILLALSLFGFGAGLNAVAPSLGTSGPQMLVWGFFISTVAVFHATVLVNSAAHKLGRRRFNTKDESRNNWWVALLTLGEGWHNNHHHYPNSVRQGVFWWEIDVTYYVLRLLEATGLIWNLRGVPRRVYQEAQSSG